LFFNECSSYALVKAPKKVSDSCAPETAYLLSKTKNGTPLTPICCACFIS